MTPVTPIFRAGRRLLRVRAVMWFSLLCAAFAAVSGYRLAMTYGINPADGGVLAPLPARLAWGLGVVLLGLSFAIGMALYGRSYVAQIGYDETSGELHISTLTFWGNHARVVQASDVLSSRRHSGVFDHGDIAVDAPWTSVTMRGRRWPLILDARAEFQEPAALRQILR